MSSLRAQLIGAARGSVLVRVASIGAALLGSVVLARAMGPATFGVYSLAFAIVSLLALPAQVGIPTLLVRETAKAHAEDRWAEMKGLWRWANRVIILSSAVIGAVGLLILFAYREYLPHRLPGVLLAGLFLIPLIALGNARGAMLRGLRHIVAGQIPESVIRPALLIVFVVFLWWYSRTVTAVAAMSVHVLAAAIAFLIGGLLLYKYKPHQLAEAVPDISSAGHWWRAALPLAMISGLQVVSNQCGIIVLSLFRSEEEVGLYKVAASAATVALFGMQTASMVISPHMARLHAIGDIDRLRKITALGALASTAMTLPVLAVFLIGGSALIGFVYGHEYKDAFMPLAILVSGQTINAMFGCVGALLGMSGQERDAAKWLSVSVAVNILGALILVPFFGMSGAAIASVLAILVWNFAYWLIAKRRLGVDSSFIPAISLAILHIRK